MQHLAQSKNKGDAVTPNELVFRYFIVVMILLGTVYWMTKGDK